MKSIVIATDFRAPSASATQYATELAKQTGAHLTVVHAYHVIPSGAEVYPSMHGLNLAQMREDSEKDTEKWCEKHIAPTGVSYSSVCEPGSAKDVVDTYLSKNAVDLLIMGTRHSWVIDKLLFGSVAAEIIPDANCPVLVIPEGYKYQPFTQIAFACDFHDSNVRNTRKLTQLAALADGEVHVVHVVNDNNQHAPAETEEFHELAREIHQQVDYDKLKFELAHATDIADTLNKYAQQTNINLLALAESDKSWIERLFSPSSTRQLLYQATVPMLFFHAKDAPVYTTTLTDIHKKYS